jgi:hypothetical protein
MSCNPRSWKLEAHAMLVHERELHEPVELAQRQDYQPEKKSQKSR